MLSSEPNGEVPAASSERAASIRDVAKLAEVSHQTVSRVLNNHPSIRDATRDRVLAAMETLQYRPNRAARALVTSKSRTLGILTSTRAHYGPSTSIQSVEAAAREADYTVVTANAAKPDEATIIEALDHLVDQAVEGIVIIAPQVRVFSAIERLNLRVPYVALQSTQEAGSNAVLVDQVAGARAATRHLIELGHRNIYHLAGPQDWIEAEARMRGFLAEMSDNDVPTTAPILGDWTADFGYRAGNELLRFRDFTAIFSSNDQMALGLLHAIRDAGLDCPRDISVVGFDDVPEAAHFWPPLTTVSQDFAEIGRRCVELLLGKIAGETRAVTPITPALIVRSSTARPAF